MERVLDDKFSDRQIQFFFFPKEIHQNSRHLLIWVIGDFFVGNNLHIIILLGP